MAQEIANEREAIFAEEAFVVDVQILLHQIMVEKGFSRADLARAMDVSRARITQIFSDECKNLTVRLLARAMHAMGETPELTCELHLEKLRDAWELRDRKLATEAVNVVPIWSDETDWTAFTQAETSISPRWDYVSDEAEFPWFANDNGRKNLARQIEAAA
jgi:transcriptional regulator with XRE-family HTH domain